MHQRKQNAGDAICCSAFYGKTRCETSMLDDRDRKKKAEKESFKTKAIKFYRWWSVSEKEESFEASKRHKIVFCTAVNLRAELGLCHIVGFSELVLGSPAQISYWRGRS